MRAVLDVNVLISAAVSRSGAPAELIRRWSGGEFELIVSPALLDELRRALAYRKLAALISAADRRELVRLIEDRAAASADPDREPSHGSPDSDDDYLLALSEAAGAALVTGDGDLLALDGRLPIYTPREFLELLDAAP